MKYLRRISIGSGIVSVCLLLTIILVGRKCGYECKAFELRKNPVFWELADNVVAAKKAGKRVELSTEKFTPELLSSLKIGAWAVSADGVIAMTRADENILLMAEPLTSEREFRWNCRIFPRPTENPVCP